MYAIVGYTFYKQGFHIVTVCISAWFFFTALLIKHAKCSFKPYRIFVTSEANARTLFS